MIAKLATCAALLLALLCVPAAGQVSERAQRRFVLKEIWRQDAICGQPHLLPGGTEFVLERCDYANEVRDTRTGELLRSLPAGSIWMVSTDWVSTNSDNEVLLLDTRDWRQHRLSPDGADVSGGRAVPRTSAPDGYSAVGSNIREIIEWRLDPRSAQFGQSIAWDETGPTSLSTVSAYAPDSSFLARVVQRNGQQHLVLGARLSGHDVLAAPLHGAPVRSLAVGPRSDMVAALDNTGTVSLFWLGTTDAPLPIDIRPALSFETGASIRPAGAHFMQFAGDGLLLIGDDAGEISAWSFDGSLVWRRRVGTFASTPVVDPQHGARRCYSYREIQTPANPDVCCL